MDEFQKYLDKVQLDILETIAQGLENGLIKSDDPAVIADFVMSRIDSIKNNNDLDIFLTELASKWPIFKNIDKIQEGEIREKEDDEEEKSVISLLKQGKINEALELAKSATKR